MANDFSVFLIFFKFWISEICLWWWCYFGNLCLHHLIWLSENCRSVARAFSLSLIWERRSSNTEFVTCLYLHDILVKSDFLNSRSEIFFWIYELFSSLKYTIMRQTLSRMNKSLRLNLFFILFQKEFQVSNFKTYSLVFMSFWWKTRRIVFNLLVCKRGKIIVVGKVVLYWTSSVC